MKSLLYKVFFNTKFSLVLDIDDFLLKVRLGKIDPFYISHQVVIKLKPIYLALYSDVLK